MVLNSPLLRGGAGGGVKPSTRLYEVLMKILHHQVNRSAAGSAHEAAVGVFSHAEREAGVVVLVKRTQGFVVLNRESESLCDPLYWEVAELLKFEFIHKTHPQPLPVREGSRMYVGGILL